MLHLITGNTGSGRTTYCNKLKAYLMMIGQEEKLDELWI